MPIKIMEAIKKSTNFVSTADIGKINLGKYTLVIIDWFAIKQLLVSVKAPEKNCQINSQT